MGRTLAPIDGSLTTLVDLADFYATYRGNDPWLIFPSRSVPGALASISFFEMVQASNRVAHALRPGRQGTEGAVVAIILNTDSLIYVALVLGLMRAGLVVSTHSYGGQYVR